MEKDIIDFIQTTNHPDMVDLVGRFGTSREFCDCLRGLEDRGKISRRSFGIRGWRVVEPERNRVTLTREYEGEEK